MFGNRNRLLQQRETLIEMFYHISITKGKELKPIFHCDVKTLALGKPTCWYLKALKFALPPTRMLESALPPTPNPNASQWNIGCVGSPSVGARVGHVHFMMVVSISFVLGSEIWAYNFNLCL